MFVNTFWSLVPPIVAIGLALLTKETYSSLFIGIVVGALLATDFSPIGALDTIINDGLTAAIADNAGIFLFLVRFVCPVCILLIFLHQMGAV